jgi:hypothetical protein
MKPEWAAILLQAIITTVGFIGIIVRYLSKQAILEKDICSIHNDLKRIEDDVKIHEISNERAFFMVESEIKKVNEKLDQLLGFFRAKNNQPL